MAFITSFEDFPVAAEAYLAPRTREPIVQFGKRDGTYVRLTADEAEQPITVLRAAVDNARRLKAEASYPFAAEG